MGIEIPRERSERDPRGARVQDRRGARRARRHGPRLPPRRRHPRGGPDRGGRADRRPREAARDAAVRHDASGRLTETQTPPAHCVRRADRARAARDRRLELRRPGARATSCAHPGEPAVELENPMSAEQSRLRTTLIGSLLDIAGRNRARGATTLRLFEAGAVYLPQPDADGASRRALPRRRPADRARPPAHLARPVTRERRLLRCQGRPRRAARHDPRAVDARQRTRTCPFLHPGRAATILVDERARRLARRDPSAASPQQWDIEETVAAFELDLDAAAATSSSRRRSTRT